MTRKTPRTSDFRASNFGLFSAFVFFGEIKTRKSHQQSTNSVQGHFCSSIDRLQNPISALPFWIDCCF
jgi:hypothetical protein